MESEGSKINQQNREEKFAGLNEDEKRAAEIIQKTFRGHRTRLQLKGFGLDASTRWYEAVRDAKYKKITTPAPPQDAPNRISEDKQSSEPTRVSPARRKWLDAAEIARRAASDDRSPSQSSGSSEESEDDLSVTTTQETPQMIEKKRQSTTKRRNNAKMMDLQYWLEMVDQKHRYGSNLRKYHNYWKTQTTSNQNFFYWLDQGDGKDVELEECSRERLDKEQVRYLSREERLNYLVKVNEEGLLIWAKNGERVWTKDELYKDSIKGIVPTSDSTPKFKYNIAPNEESSSSSSSDEDNDEEDGEEDDIDNTAGDEGERYVNEDFHRAKGPAKLKYVGPAVLFNHMIRTSLKKGHKWIFVADTSFRLYIGYKQSGAFQHSSFLHGARISAAGLIKVKDGQLRSLSPLSGHYRPPVANFRAFVHNLRETGVDMSRVSISKSYAVLVGLESYTRTRKKVVKAKQAVEHTKDQVFNPEKVRLEEEAQRDKSKSAAREKQFLEEQQQIEAAKLAKAKLAANRKSNKSLGDRFTKVFGIFRNKDPQSRPAIGDPSREQGEGPEDGIPAPDGTR